MKHISQLFVFGLGEQRFGLDLDVVQRIERSVEITKIPEAPPLISGIIDYHGTILPVYDLRKKLGLPVKPVSISMLLIIVSTSERPLALVADTVEGVMNVPKDGVTSSENLEKGLAQDSFVRLGDGFIFIYDVDRFLSSQDSIELGIALKRFEGRMEES
ncbi:MAG: chemotaxis protein CheW [Bacteroidota bacterium]